MSGEDNLFVCNTKLSKIFDSFLSPKCRIYNDVYLEMLLSHLSGKYDEEYLKILRQPYVIEWIEKICTIIAGDSDGGCPSSAIVAFTLKLLAVIIKDEDQFNVIAKINIFNKIQEALKTNPKLQTPSVKLANVIYLAAIAKHETGFAWIRQTKAWSTVITYCEKNHTVYVIREAMAFIYFVLDRIEKVDKDDALVEEVIREVCKNLPKSSIGETKLISITVDDSDIQQKLTPTLNLISYILQRCVETQQSSRIVHHLMVTMELGFRMWKLADMTYDHNFLEPIFRVFVMCNFAQLECREKDTKPDLNQFSVNFFNYMHFSIIRRSYMNIFKMADLNHTMWKQLEQRVPEEFFFEKQRIKFEDQCIILQIIPIIFIIRKGCSDSEYFENYVLKLFDISSEHTTRLCYAFRELIHSMDNVEYLACKSIQGVLSLKNILHRDRAILVFQALMFTLKGYVPGGAQTESKNSANLASQPNLLSAILTGMHTIIEYYKITWKESIEAMALVTFMQWLLHNPNLTTRVAVQALKLTQLGIERFLAPNLALLVDSVQGCGLEKLGPNIMKRLHDVDWETRDSALELLSSMVVISDMKFPAFQQHIFDNGICPVVFAMAKNDQEAYVRASALKCLNEMMKIQLFWEQCLENVDLVSHLITVLNNESEGVVRREAAELVAMLYDDQKIPQKYYDSVFSTMADRSVNDLYWEVKTAALKFWKIFMCDVGRRQGIIDGTFPNVTFSIESKKIVTLTHREIILRLKKVMDELAMRGCLGVYLTNLNDDCDLEVVKAAGDVVQKLLDFLNKYNYITDSREILSPTINKLPNGPCLAEACTSSATLLDNDAIASNAQTSTNQLDDVRVEDNYDEIIDMIVESDDIKLLAETYENKLKVNLTETNTVDEFYYKKLYVDPDEFLDQVIKFNMEETIKNKSDWISQTESFDSLCDDILLSFKDMIVNDADCY